MFYPLCRTPFKAVVILVIESFWNITLSTVLKLNFRRHGKAVSLRLLWSQFSGHAAQQKETPEWRSASKSQKSLVRQLPRYWALRQQYALITRWRYFFAFPISVSGQKPSVCITDAAAILQDERAKQTCRKFLQTGTAPRESGTVVVVMHFHLSMPVKIAGLVM